MIQSREAALKCVAEAYKLCYGLSIYRASLLTPEFCRQLLRCKNEEARRLLLKISR